jgi:polysaccharide export outer membrane protein
VGVSGGEAVNFRPAASSAPRKPLFGFLQRSRDRETAPPPALVQGGTPCSRCTPVVASTAPQAAEGPAVMLRPVPAGTVGTVSAWSPVQRTSGEGVPAGVAQLAGGAVVMERPQPVVPVPPTVVPPLVGQGATDPTILPPPNAGDLPASAAPPVKPSTRLPAPSNGRKLPALFAGKPHGLADLPPVEVPHPVEAPREFDKRALAAYIIEPPDILVIQATSAITLPNQPIGGPHLVRPDGQISLGAYGEVFVAGRTIEGARVAVADHLLRLRRAEAERPLTKEDILALTPREEMLKRLKREDLLKKMTTADIDAALLRLPDSRIRSAFTDKELAEMRETKKQAGGVLTVEDILKELKLDVAAYNSKFYYIITDGGGYGATVLRFPYTGNETVLDALSQIAGLPVVASKKRIRVARATPHDHAPIVLPVDWCGITQRGSAATNYQLFPGDRIYVDSDRLIKADTLLAKIFSPVERIFGITLLGSTTIHSIRGR